MMQHSGMSTKMMEQKMKELTQRVERLEAQKKPLAKPSWEKVIGTSKGDEMDREAARLGAEWRATQNKRRR